MECILPPESLIAQSDPGIEKVSVQKPLLITRALVSDDIIT